MTKMQFRLLLECIARMSPNGAEFDARSLYYYIMQQPSFVNLNTTVKLVSNDLNRLYRMQLVSRKKVKRPAGSVHGYRGFMYSYRLNKQGKSYVNYLRRTFFIPNFQDYMRKFTMRTNLQSKMAISKIEREMGKKIDDLDETYAEYLYLYSKPGKGRQKRFPPRISFEFVKGLMDKKRKLEQENAALKSELEAAQRELSNWRLRSLF